MLTLVSCLDPQSRTDLTKIQSLVSFGLVVALVTLAIDQNPQVSDPHSQTIEIEQSLKTYAEVLAPTGGDPGDRDQALAIMSVAADLGPEVSASSSKGAASASSSRAAAPASSADP